MGFNVRRDSSPNNIPVIGYQDAADAQDVILWAAVQVTETGNTDANGNFQATNLPIIDATHDWFVDAGGVGRQRLIDGKDITAHDSNNNPLYAGQANGQTGQIPLYKDSGLTTSAANMQNVTVTYWTLRPVAVDQQGRLIVSINSTLNVQLTGSLPAGTNNIGHVNVDSLPSLPPGSNNIGQVEIFNPNDGGGEVGSVRIRDSMAGNPLAGFAYNSDGKSLPPTSGSGSGIPLLVSALPWLYNGNGTVSRQRNARIFKYATLTASGTVWAGTSGSPSLRGFFLLASAAITVQFTIAGSPVGPLFPLAQGIPVFCEFPNIWTPGTAGQVQTLGLNFVSGSGTVAVMVWGTEE